MNYSSLIFLLCLLGCEERSGSDTDSNTSAQVVDTKPDEAGVIASTPGEVPLSDTASLPGRPAAPSPGPAKHADSMHNPAPTPAGIYSNKAFRDVEVKREGSRWEVKGRARVFEAALSWVVEDGHNELLTGHTMTDAGAPEWGRFSFSFPQPKITGGRHPHLILFEASAKDGSRQHELIIPLSGQANR